MAAAAGGHRPRLQKRRFGVRTRLGWLVAAIALIVGFVSLMGQRTAQTPSEFSNIVVLKDMTDQEIRDTMELWVKQVGLTCMDCHVEGDYASEEKHEKQIARQMYRLVQALNQQEFFSSGGRKADCFLCHRGVKYIPAQVDK
jgi:hypothetical protein